MKWFFTLILCLPAIFLMAQNKNREMAKANIYHEEEVYTSRITVDKFNNQIKPLRFEELPMAVSQMVNELKDSHVSVLTYKVITGEDLSKTYFLAVVSDKQMKKKIYYDKEGKIAKIITLFD